MRKSLLVLAMAGVFCSANAMAQADNTDAKIDPAMPAPTYNSWMHDSSTRNNGYISRQEYMDEMGRRWDRMDANKKGLTMAQINSMYGTPEHTKVNAGSNRTNPTGTELKGESGG
jgi:hypothetical protein